MLDIAIENVASRAQLELACGVLVAEVVALVRTLELHLAGGSERKSLGGCLLGCHWFASPCGLFTSFARRGVEPAASGECVFDALTADFVGVVMLALFLVWQWRKSSAAKAPAA